MPSFSQALRSSTSTFRPCSLPSFLACSARKVGVQWLPGRLAHSRASAVPSAMACARLSAAPSAAGSRLGAQQRHRRQLGRRRARWAWSRGRRRVPSATAATSASACAAVQLPPASATASDFAPPVFSCASARPTALRRALAAEASPTAANTTRAAFTPAPGARTACWPALQAKSPALMAAASVAASGASRPSGGVVPATSTSSASAATPGSPAAAATCVLKSIITSNPKSARCYSIQLCVVSWPGASERRWSSSSPSC